MNLLPKCPKCEDGRLLPFSFKTDVFEVWKCSHCGHRVEKR